MSDDEMTSFLILKYGSLGEAMLAWLMDESSLYTPEENDFLERYTADQFPNLTLIHSGEVDN